MKMTILTKKSIIDKHFLNLAQVPIINSEVLNIYFHKFL